MHIESSKLNGIRLIAGPDLDGPGGVANYYRTILKHLPAEFEYIAIGTRYRGRNIPALLRLVVDVVRVNRAIRGRRLLVLNPSLGPRGFFRDALFLRLAHLHGIPATVFWRGWDSSFETIVGNRLRRLFALTFGRARNMICLAEDFAEKLRGWGYAGPIAVETTSVDDDLLSSADRTRRPAGDLFRVLFLSRLERDKGIYEILEVARLLRGGPVRFTLAGSGSEEASLRRSLLEQKDTNIRLVGYVSGAAKAALYAESDAFIFPSSHGEGMPNAVLEAMALGLPVITTRVGGIADFFDENRMGIALTSVDASALARAVTTLAADRHAAAAAGEYNAAFARRYFLASVVARRYMTLCDQETHVTDGGVTRWQDSP